MISGPPRMGGEGRVGLALGPIDGRVGGRIDDQRRPVGGQRGFDRGRGGDVALGPRQPGQRDAACLSQRRELATQLAAGAEEQDRALVHDRPSRSPR